MSDIAGTGTSVFDFKRGEKTKKNRELTVTASGASFLQDKAKGWLKVDGQEDTVRKTFQSIDSAANELLTITSDSWGVRHNVVGAIKASSEGEPIIVNWEETVDGKLTVTKAAPASSHYYHRAVAPESTDLHKAMSAGMMVVYQHLLSADGLPPHGVFRLQLETMREGDDDWGHIDYVKKRGNPLRSIVTKAESTDDPDEIAVTDRHDHFTAMLASLPHFGKKTVLKSIIDTTDSRYTVREPPPSGVGPSRYRHFAGPKTGDEAQSRARPLFARSIAKPHEYTYFPTTIEASNILGHSLIGDMYSGDDTKRVVLVYKGDSQDVVISNSIQGLRETPRLRQNERKTTVKLNKDWTWVPNEIQSLMKNHISALE